MCSINRVSPTDDVRSIAVVHSEGGTAEWTFGFPFRDKKSFFD
ncbi:hypothetical protein [Peribacillus sp. TH14]|nr:hypothetical protein [Peribacillus sp. TH14]